MTTGTIKTGIKTKTTRTTKTRTKTGTKTTRTGIISINNKKLQNAWSFLFGHKSKNEKS
jgi:hypothetical protein